MTLSKAGEGAAASASCAQQADDQQAKRAAPGNEAAQRARTLEELVEGPQTNLL